MQQGSTKHSTAPSGADFLPDFCAGPKVFTVLFITQLVAVLLTLAVVDAGPGLWMDLFWLSLYLQWIGLCSAIGLCTLRRYLHSMPGVSAAFLAYGLLLLITGVISEMTFQLGAYMNLPIFFSTGHAEFLVRSIGVCAVVSGLALRYFWLQHQWRRETLATGQARYELLQARIRPHFLFNSLNSIAELTASHPADAETAVEDLAALFRANLSQGNQPVTLTEELSLCRAYLRMEKLRLGERLQTDWAVESAAETALLPPLILQPLLENAVRHGIECMPEGGCIRISARLAEDERLLVDIRNPVGELRNPGTGEALLNIEQRLHWLYAEKARLSTRVEGEQFHASLALPCRPPES